MQNSSSFIRHLGITLAVAIGSLLAGGCQQSQQPAAEPAQSTQSTRKIEAVEYWDALFVQGMRLGHMHTVVKPIERDGQQLVSCTSETTISVKRYGQNSEQTITVATVERPSGEMLEYSSSSALGTGPMTVNAAPADRPSGEVLEITTTQAGGTQATSIPWSADILGMYGAEQRQSNPPLAVDETRQYKMFMPMFNTVADIKLTGRGTKETKLLDGRMQSLNRVDSVATFADGNQLAATVWTNARGETIKSRTDAMQQETYRVPESVALAKSGGDFDLGLQSMIKIDSPLKSPHQTKRLRYEVQLEGENLRKVFANCPSQHVKPVSDNVAEITVVAIRPDDPPQTPPGVKPPVAGDTAANSLVQSDDPNVLKIAKSIAAESRDDWQTCLALEKAVHALIRKKNFSQAFASAAEVANSREGDCTEHAVLLAALCRARGIPARVAIGLVYVERDQAFGYHMWTEAFVGDRWIPLDATLGQGGIGGGHLKLLDTNLEGASAFSSFLPVAQVLGRLKIRVLDAE